MLTEAQINRLNEKLNEQKMENEKVLQGENSESVPEEGTGELSSYDNHPADRATELSERETDAALNNQAQAQNEQIEKALQAIKNGTYGICEVCGKEIPYERLELVPETLRCTDHAEADVQDNVETAEEDVLDPGIGADRGNEEVIYDKEDTWESISVHGTSQTPSDVPEEERVYHETNNGPDKA
ncbi:TraR/DksA C4-type zinc finger protein [Salibacterium aidingense]|uniref:TraR/DksA C4-type zinc finger protein n=1 Tax=Salibacterium aidingense TaxID=384933 RepID=UPI003BE7C412